MWKSIDKYPPPENIRVKIRHHVTCPGAPEREGWNSTGIFHNGRWRIKYVHGYSFSKPVTHWYDNNYFDQEEKDIERFIQFAKTLKNEKTRT